MLGKLIKYDLKSLSRFLIVMHAFLLLISVLGRVFLTSNINLIADSSDFDSNRMLLALTFVFYVIVIVGASFGTFAIIAVRFYKSLYSDEGYLSHTLPVTKGTHLAAKTISGSIWAFIDCVALVFSMWILMATPSVTAAYQENKKEVLEILGFANDRDLSNFILLFVALLLIGAISSTILLYAAISCGQLFSGHRVLGAVVCYFALQTIISIITTLLMSISGYFNLVFAVRDDPTAVQFAEFTGAMIKYTLWITILYTALLYIVTYILLKKKVNLH